MTGLVFEVHEQIAELTLDNPAKLNCLTPAMLAGIASWCDKVEEDDGVLGLIVKATGDRFFCAGADINAWADMPPAEFARQWIRQGHRVMDRLARLSKPTIAVMEGHAFGGGLELAAACDLRIMAPHAQLALPETSIGIVPGWSGSQRLARLLPESVLKEMAMFGRRLSAERALALGFAAEVQDDPLAAARLTMANLKHVSPAATEVAKYMIHAAAGEDAGAMIEALGGGMAAAGPGKAEGVAAFRAKRKPKFSGGMT